MQDLYRQTAVVFGGSGFLGRYVVTRLAHQGYIVRVAVRRPERALFLKTAGGVGQIVPFYAPVTDEAAVARATAGASVVVNLVGILSEGKAGDFDKIHNEGAGRVARAAAAAGAAHLVQVSAIGADPASPSLYGASKGRGEAAVRAAFPEAVILRPSVVFGPEDNFFNQFAGIARLSPVMPVFSGKSRLQPVFVEDVADAVCAAIARPEARGQTYELGGPGIYPFRKLLAYILQVTHRARPLIDVPPGLARLQARVMEHLPGKPLTRDQLKMLERDNVAAEGVPGLAALGVTPTPVEWIVPGYLRRYRQKGGRAAET
jgi:NADH dehydrogenase